VGPITKHYKSEDEENKQEEFEVRMAQAEEEKSANFQECIEPEEESEESEEEVLPEVPP
jgi:hypothetical protein